MSLLKKVENIIKKNKLFYRKHKLLVALSGGIDSIALADILYKLEYNVSFAHCNFKLRGTESDEDENFVTSLSKKYNVILFKTTFDTKNFAKSKKISIQEAARILRYNYFEEILAKYNLDYIVTAHTFDDNVETFFINLFRSTGLMGLKAIPIKSNKIVRPLLFVTRNEIFEYVKENNLQWSEDSSNQEDKYLRNAIRHSLIPVIKNIQNNFFKNFSISLSNISEHITLYEHLKKNLIDKSIINENESIKIDLNKINKCPNYYILLFDILKNYNFNFKQVKNFCSNIHQKGTYLSSDTHIAFYEKNLITISALNTTHNYTKFEITEDVSYINEPISITIKKYKKEDNFNIDPSPKKAYFDLDKINFPLTIRKWKKGDKFMPLGMSKFKKLSDFFIDNKFTNIQKQQTWLLCSGSNILWVIGYRIDDRFKITNNTKYILELNLLN